MCILLYIPIVIIRLCLQNLIEKHKPPPYDHEVWHYKYANVDCIRQAVDIFNWNGAFLNADGNAEVDIFNTTISNILSNFILHEILTIEVKDLPWFNTAFKNIICVKNEVYRNLRRNKIKGYVKLLKLLD